MKLQEAKAQFIASWGAFGTHWGISRTMAQVHALLLISPDAITADDIMEELQISRGNANMNIRELIDWGLIDRVIVPGARKEYFSAEKDIWKVAKQIVKERKKRELEPMIKMMTLISDVEGDKKDKHVKQFMETLNGIKKLTEQADKTLENIIKAEESWFWGAMIKMFK
jgi:DNA-binding transcriptional regulator GbsR (MarR family)